MRKWRLAGLPAVQVGRRVEFDYEGALHWVAGRRVSILAIGDGVYMPHLDVRDRALELIDRLQDALGDSI